MKLVIQIPCYNEEESLPVTLSQLPRHVPGFDLVEWLVVDDGSTDGTVAVARSLGADHVVSHQKNRGLARAFMSGIQESLARGADVIVNTDADNQYNADDISVLLEPILDHRAEMVVGARPISSMPRFTPVNRLLHAVGCFVVRLASGTDIPDAPSGFRAFSREAAQRLTVYDTYTYTLETIIQAGRLRMPLTFVPIRVNIELRPSRLISSNTCYVLRSALTIVRTFALYRPLQFYGFFGVALVAAGQMLSFLSRSVGTILTVVGCLSFLALFAIERTPRRRKIRADIDAYSSKGL